MFSENKSGTNKTHFYFCRARRHLRLHKSLHHWKIKEQYLSFLLRCMSFIRVWRTYSNVLGTITYSENLSNIQIYFNFHTICNTNIYSNIHSLKYVFVSKFLQMSHPVLHIILLEFSCWLVCPWGSIPSLHRVHKIKICTDYLLLV